MDLIVVAVVHFLSLSSLLIFPDMYRGQGFERVLLEATALCR